MHGADFAKGIVADGLNESEATSRVLAECPEWTRHRVLRYFAAAKLFGYSTVSVDCETKVYQNGLLVPAG